MPAFNKFVATNMPRANTAQTNVPVQEREKEYKHNIVRSQETPLESVLAHVKGSSYTVDYYAQILTSNQQPTPYDSEQSTNHQQYHLIYNLELKLQDHSTSTEVETHRLETTATAVVYAGVIPNVGDVIIADKGSGVAGRYGVTKVEKKMYTKDTVYEIDFEFIEYLDNKESIDWLNRYVVRESVFNGELITYGNNAILAKDEYNDYLSAKDKFREVMDDYLKEFFSNEFATLEVPGYGTSPTYDPFAVEALKAITNIGDHPLLTRLRVLNVNEIKEAFDFSIWNVLLDPSIHKIHNIWKEAGPVSSAKFSVNHAYNSFRYSGFRQCISPVEDLENVDYYRGWNRKSKVGNILSTNYALAFTNERKGTLIGNQVKAEMDELNGETGCLHANHTHSHDPIKMLNPIDAHTHMDTINLWLRATGHHNHHLVCQSCAAKKECDKEEDDYSYVLPKTFWDDKYLDDDYLAVIRKHVNEKAITLKEVFSLLALRFQWTPQQRFYRMLVLMIILVSVMRGL